MKETPLYLNSEMVRAVLDGRKNQTRLVIKPQPLQKENGWYWGGGRALRKVGYGADYVHTDLPSVISAMKKVSYQAGDRLYIRETWAPEADRIVYRADKAARYFKFGQKPPTPVGDVFWLESTYEAKKWAPSFMLPKWAARIMLEITDVRVQRIQEISEEDAEAEGCDNRRPLQDDEPASKFIGTRHHLSAVRLRFEALWESIEGAGSWEKNGFVWALTFKRVE